jgi:hypothetical protein
MTPADSDILHPLAKDYQMKTILSTAIVLLTVGCAPAPSIQQGPNAEVTFDGLVRIDNSAFKEAWVDPDVDLTQYTKIMPGGAEFEYRAVKKNTSASMARRSSLTEYWISDENREVVRQIVTEAFREELLLSKNFTFANTRGPDVLIITGALHDIVSRVPPETVGRSEVFLSSVGEATLILEARDSLTDETIYRAVDRRSAEQSGGDLMRASSVRTKSEVRRMAKRWASRLREGLDSIHE